MYKNRISILNVDVNYKTIQKESSILNDKKMSFKIELDRFADEVKVVFYFLVLLSI